MQKTPPVRSEMLHHDAEFASTGLPPLLLEADHLVNTIIAGLHGRRRAGAGETFWQYRPYVQGDISTQIDWRQSARSANRLYIRQREWEVAATAWLWRDPGHSLDYSSSRELPTKKYRSEVLATALCALLTRAGERVGYAGATRRPFIGRKAAEQFAGEILSQPFSDERLPPIVSSAGQKKSVLLSDFFIAPDLLETRFKAMAAEGTQAHLVQVVDPSEEDYPFRGRTEFLSRNPNDPALLFGDAAAIAREYRRLFKAHRSWLADICRHLGWTFSIHRTDHSPETALISLYRTLAPEVLV